MPCRAQHPSADRVVGCLACHVNLFRRQRVDVDISLLGDVFDVIPDAILDTVFPPFGETDASGIIDVLLDLVIVQMHLAEERLITLQVSTTGVPECLGHTPEPTTINVLLIADGDARDVCVGEGRPGNTPGLFRRRRLYASEPIWCLRCPHLPPSEQSMKLLVIPVSFSTRLFGLRAHG